MTVWISRADLEDFACRLRRRMEELRQQIDAVRERERDESFLQVAGEAHDAADAAVANLAFDTENAAIQRARDERREVDEALGRFAAGSYGICLRCGQLLERARLDAYPAAKRHSQCQQAHDVELRFGRVSERFG